MRVAPWWLILPAIFACSELTESSGEQGRRDAPERALPAGETVRARDSIHIAHILIGHEGALRSNNNPRTKDAAKQLAGDVLKRARAGEDFGKLARRYSEDPVGKAKEGDLPNFTRDDQVKSFADAAFALKPGQLSDVVETPLGFHIILRKD